MFPRVLPLLGESRRICLISPRINTCELKHVITNVKCGLPGKFIGDSVLRAFAGVIHVDILCLARTKIPDLQKESRGSA